MFHIQKHSEEETPYYELSGPKGETVDRTPTLSTTTDHMHSSTTPTQQTTSLRSTASFASEQTLVQDTQWDHELILKSVKATDASLPKDVNAILLIEGLHSTLEGVYGGKVLALTQSNTVRLLQTVGFSAFVERKHIVLQVQDIVGQHAYQTALWMQVRPTRFSIRVYEDSPLDEYSVPSESNIEKLENGKEVLLRQCSPQLQERARLLLLL